ncbi:MAG: ABC transporter permease [Bacillota bacterium]
MSAHAIHTLMSLVAANRTFGENLIRFVDLVGARREELIQALYEHMLLVLIPVGLAIVIAVPLGILATRYRAIEVPALGLANIGQTIPSLALLALMIPLGLGIGRRPAYIALLIYAILPILRNTFTGITSVDSSLKRAARGMGMTDIQMLTKVELPLAFPVIMAGIRTSTVIIIGTAVLAAYIGGGGLGQFIVTGLGLVRDDLILLGAIPSALLAIVADLILGRLEDWVTPRGLKV